MNFKRFLNDVAPYIIGSLTGFTITIAIFFAMKDTGKEKDSYDTASEYMRELQMSYQGTKSDLVDEVQDYIDNVSPDSGLRGLIVVETCEEFSVPVAFVLAQGELESHFGTKGLAVRTNSVWNVGAYDGHDYENISGKHKYKNPNESVRPYLELLTRLYLSGRTVDDLMENFTDTSGNRYASSIHYEEMLKIRYERILKTTRIDSLQSRLNYYKIRL